jgi:uncharacterized peroxidase-related enzyme
VLHHCEALRRSGVSEELAWQIAYDYANSQISAADKLMLAYAAQLTVSPYMIKESSVVQLRQAGFTDEQILLINLTVSYFNFVNRLATGLGVQPEAGWDKDKLAKLAEITG